MSGYQNALGVVAVNASFGINSWPSYNVSFTPSTAGSGGTSSVTIGAATAQAWLGSLQSRMLQPDGLKASLSIDVDGKPAIDTDGFVTGVSSILCTGTFRISISMLPEYAAIDAIDLSLYKSGFTSADKELYDRIASVAGKARGKGKLSGFIRCIVEEYIMSQETVEAARKSFSDKSIGKELATQFDQVHSMNGKLIPTFYELLENSEELDSAYGVKKLVDQSFNIGYGTKLAESVVDCLTRSNGSFLSAICSLANMFRCVYVPGKQSVGRLLPKRAMLRNDSAADKTDWTVVSLNGNAHNGSSMPLSSVSIVIPRNPQAQDIELIHGKNNIAMYTRKDAGEWGRALRISPPDWIPPVELSPCAVDKEKGKAPKKTGYSPTDLAGTVKETIKEVRNNSGEAMWRDLFTEWCRDEMMDQLFGNYVTAFTSTTHELSCGKRVRHDMGSGFLCHTSMNLNIVGGGRGSMRTVYTCTHSVYDDSVLSGLN